LYFARFQEQVKLLTRELNDAKTTAVEQKVSLAVEKEDGCPQYRNIFAKSEEIMYDSRIIVFFFCI
jgi:hypothetical protein